ncbi:hypothetical protein IFM89_024972 [Coptis chinensis]|uniref:Uncharacterized protein n=1 Tax=Coptis chinensis TaxID=261450 RepID=A0A835HX09_9MAGN|nr:hypothetical protein IFM89_024972 [Coptis chinensis]
MLGTPVLFLSGTRDYRAALCDVQAILTLSPGYRMFEGRVAATQLCTLVREHVALTIGQLQIVSYNYMISGLQLMILEVESDATKGVLYFRQSLLLLRLNCPEVAMRSLQLARHNAASEHERLVYEGWILYDTSHCEEGLRKAKGINQP